MTLLAQVALTLTVLAGPLLVLLVDVGPHLRARTGRQPRGGHRVVVVGPDVRPVHDLTLVVPIYGDLRYLENVAWLSTYGNRVLLVTTGVETPAFYRDLYALAGAHGFRVHVAAGVRTTTGAGRRGTAGTVRDAIVRDAHSVLTSQYVVCVDADTVIDRPVGDLVGALHAAGLDVGSVPLAVAPHNLLTRLQRVEYALAMRLRRVMPWLVCGGCHVARRTVHAELMRRHSLFFQGNDVELGLLAVARGYRVGHLDVPVVTAVPATPRAWWRQRLAWAGGEFRIMVVNLRLGARHPYLYLYGAVVTFALLPLRWWSALHAGWGLLLVVVAYAALTVLLTRDLRDPVAWVYPAYTLLYSFLLLGVGWLTYTLMAVRSGNAGVIRPREAWWLPDPPDAPVVRRLPGPGPARASDWWARR